MITVQQPAWLLLAIPLVATLYGWRMPGSFLILLRGVLYVLVVAVMAGLTVELPRRSGTVVVAVDRSRSMPSDSDARALELIRFIEEARGPDDALVVLGFGRTAVVEQASSDAAIRGFHGLVEDDASNYAEALERGLSMIPAGSRGTILVLGDGRWTGQDPAIQAARASARGVTIDHRLYERPRTGDVAIARLETPSRVNPGEGYLLTAWVQAPTSKEIHYALRRGNLIVARGQRNLAAGMNRLVFRDRASRPGVARYQLSIQTRDGVQDNTGDPIPENNRANFLIGIQGPRPILHLAPKADSALGDLLRAGKLDVETTTGDDIEWSLAQLAEYSAVVIENVSSQTIGATGMRILADWVRQTGGGLMMTGGQRSFGPGGYFKSPLEEILPVSMELRREHRKLAVAIVVALDRSGSMAVPVDSGRTKMDLANVAAAEVVDMLSPTDQFGAWAVDSTPHRIAELQRLENPARLKQSLLSIQSMGGGIFVYEALTAAISSVAKSELDTRHVILFSDAADSEEPGNYMELLEKATAAGITVSVIGMGTEADVDAALLKDIARRGNGRCFFTQQPKDLPRLFAQDALIVARNTFIDAPVDVRLTGEFASLVGTTWELDRPVGGYNVTYPRPGASQAAVTEDEYRAPFIAAWQAGSGRALAYTGEADGQFTGAIAEWPHIGPMFTSLVRWTSGRDPALADGSVLTQELIGNLLRVTLHLDPTRPADPFTTTPVARVLCGKPGQPPQVRDTLLQWVGPDELVAETTLSGDQTAIVTVEVNGRPVALEPVQLPYSPEFEPIEHSRGAQTLTMLSTTTGGKARTTVGEIWHDLPKQQQSLPLTPWLATAALVTLLTEVFERRSGALSRWRGVAWKRERAPLTAARPPVREKRLLSPDRPVAAVSPTAEPAAAKEPTPSSLDDALLAARRRAQNRRQS